jgi:hypothetical protein
MQSGRSMGIHIVAPKGTGLRRQMMHQSTRAILEGKDPPLPQPIRPLTSSEQLCAWFDERVGKADMLAQLYSVSILLQTRYFFLRRREQDEATRSALASAYERCYDRLEERILETDAPLPQLRQEPVTPPPFEAQDYTEFWQEL